MSSFYGNNTGIASGGITPGEVNAKIENAEELMKNHIYFSKIEPTVQKAGDIWMVLTEFPDSYSELVENFRKKREEN